MTESKPLILVDGSSWLHRAFNALPPLTTQDGLATGAIFGVVNMLRRLLKDYEPDYLGVIFDAPGKTFRHNWFPDYKATRGTIDKELIGQIQPLHDFIRALGLPLLQVPGVEADDVIGTLTEQAQARDWSVIIVSSDKDLAQLVSEKVVLLDTMKNVITDSAGVQEKFGVLPELIIDWIALVGDRADNIPGIPGVGKITAAKWLNQYGSLESLVAHAPSISGKIGEKLRAGLEQLALSRSLATLNKQVALDLNIDDLRINAPDIATLHLLCERYEFHSWRHDLPPVAEQEVAADLARQGLQQGEGAGNYSLILNQTDLDQLLEKLKAVQRFALGIETTSLNYLDARIVGLSFSICQGEAVYLPLAHDDPHAPAQLNREQVLAQLRPLLEDPTCAKIGQNIKYDRHVFANHGIKLRGIQHDTMLQSYILDSTGRHNLDDLAQRYLRRSTTRYAEITGTRVKQLDFNQATLEQARLYAAEDADITLRLHHCLCSKLAAEPSLQKLYAELEMPLLAVLGDIERTGVLIDTTALSQQSSELASQIVNLEQQAYELAGAYFNLGSPKQIQTILFERLQLPVGKKTRTGKISTAEEVLQDLAVDYPLPRIILEYRALSKLKSTYTDRLPQQVNAHTRRVHTSYNQAVTSTGRLSSSDPNLQNIPVRTIEGRRIRQAFIPAAGYSILAADYSQIELRIMAHLSNDAGLLGAFASGADIHRITAAEVFDTGIDAVTTEQRRSAKAINFGIIYGMSAFGLAKQLGIKRGAAEQYIARYFKRYPEVKTYMDKVRSSALEHGYVATLYGRRLYVPDMHSKNMQRRQVAERAVINAPMQGTAADIIKFAMLRVADWLATSKFPARMIMQVHDELVFEVRSTHVEEARQSISELMTTAAQLQVALEIETGIGSNWDEAH